MSEVPRFWREAKHRYRLVGTRCTNCNTLYFPPREICPVCRRESVGKMRDEELSGEGEIYSYTIVHDGLDQFRMQIPYVMALIKMSDGPLVTGQIVDCRPEDVKIGAKVSATLRKVRVEGKEGIIQYGYKFVLKE
ncbi:MAG: Zn-ribbon domain-containing OB-fold protein [Thermoplasmatales archaeon]